MERSVVTDYISVGGEVYLTLLLYCLWMDNWTNTLLADISKIGHISTYPSVGHVTLHSPM